MKRIHWIFTGWLLAGAVSASVAGLRAEEGDGPEDGKKPFSRSVELTDAALEKIKTKYEGGTIVSQKSYWFGNAGAAGNGTKGGTRRWEVVVKTTREVKLPDGKTKKVEELHTLQVKKDGYVVSQSDPLDITELPENIKDAALQASGGTKIETAYKSTSGPTVRYKVKADKGSEVTYNSDGSVVPPKYTSPQEATEGE